MHQGSNPWTRNQLGEFFTNTLYLLICNVAPSNGVCPAGNQVWMLWSDVTSFDVSQLDPVLIAQALAAGWILVGTFWAIGKAVKLILDMIRHG